NMPVLAEGKTKVVFAHENAALAVIVHKDDITAGDGARRNELPGKGALSGRTTANVFRVLEGAGIPTHFVDAQADDRMVVRRCKMIPLEVVMRRIATGSYLKRAAVTEGTRFDPVIVETFFKDDANHDPLVDAAWIEEHGIASPAEIEAIAGIGRQVFETLERVWAAQDVQLVDMKIEFGRDSNGNLLVADVIDNDSWRLWPGGRKEEMLDKQVYRNITEVTDENLRTVLAKYRQVATMSDAFSGVDDKPKEACGVFGIWGGQGADVASTTLLGLMALQHRGQESAGVATLDNELISVTRGMGRVDQIFRQEQVETMRGIAAIGHTRYSTTGESRIENAQPLMVERGAQAVALAHNGNIVNPLELRELVIAKGGTPETSSDSELLAWLVLLDEGTWEERIREMMRVARGAYSLAILTNDAVFAVRDPLGLRPLCLGWRDDHWMVASESCALDTVGAEMIRDIEPGEILRIDHAGLRGNLMENPPKQALCVFEQIYFARPDSVLGGLTAFEARVAMGRQLAKEHPVAADLVIGVPDSGVPAAIGYAQELGLPLSEGLVKNRYIGRTFIQPDQHSRQAGIRLKFNPLRGAVKGKRVIVVDDSVVRGNTMPKIVELLRRGGATAVHLRVSSPPIAHPCFFGIDMGARDGLIANGRNFEEIRQLLGVDTLGYLSIPGLQKAIGDDRRCYGCLTGRYPVRVDEPVRKNALEKQLAAADPSGLDVLVIGSGGRE
ncbi:MAG: amidophosphoribosyltransferase, partial [Thermomicrobiales bacterium]